MTPPPSSSDDTNEPVTLEAVASPMRRSRRRYAIGGGVAMMIAVWAGLYSLMSPPEKTVMVSAKTALQRVKSKQELSRKEVSAPIIPAIQEKKPIAPVAPKVIAVAPPPPMPTPAPMQPNLGELSQSSVAVAKQFLDRLDAHEQETQQLQQRIRALEQERDHAYTQHATTLQHMNHIAQLRHHLRAGTLAQAHLTPLLEDANLPTEVKEPLLFFAEHKEPVPSDATLRATYDAALTTYYAELHQSAATEDEGWYAALKREVRSWVRIRKVGSRHKGKDDASIIARAEAALAQGDVAKALEEVQRLSVHASPYFAVWRAQAHHYEATYRMMEDAEHALMQHMKLALPHPTSSSTH
jgi:hypothetical protein